MSEIGTDKSSQEGSLYSQAVEKGDEVGSYLADQIGVQTPKEDVQIKGDQDQSKKGVQDGTIVPKTIQEEYNLDEFGEGHPLSEKIEKAGQAGDQGSQGDQGDQGTQDKGQQASKDDPTQFEYWQSQTDIQKGINQEVFKSLGVTDLEQFKANFSQLSQLIPYANVLASNPALLNQVMGNQAGDTQGQTKLVRPTPPEEPAGFDRTEAENDPKSESYAYRRKKEAYFEELTTYNEQVNSKFDEKLQTEADERNYQSVRNTRKLEIMRNNNKTEAEAEEIVKWLESNASVSTQNYVRLYDLEHAKAEDVIARERKAKELKEAKALAEAIPPVLVGQSTPIQQEIDENDAMSISLIQGGKKVSIL